MTIRKFCSIATFFIVVATVGFIVADLAAAQEPLPNLAKGTEPTPDLSDQKEITSSLINQIDPTLLYKIEPQLLKQALTSVDRSAPFIVYLNTQTDVAAAADAASVNLGAQNQPNEIDKRRAIVGALKQTARTTQFGVIQTLQQTAGLSGQSLTGTKIKPLWIVNAVAASGSFDMILRLAARPDVKIVRLDKQVSLERPTKAQNVARLPRDGNQISDQSAVEWGVEKIRADLVHDALGINGTGVVVANIDTGVDWFHPALQANYRGYRGTGKLPLHAGNWYDATGEGTTYPVDGDGHGTHTIGTIVGSSGIGVAPGAQWIAIRAFDSSGNAFNSWIHEAFQWALAPNDDPALAPDIVNNSWGNDNGFITEFEADIEALLNAGIYPVFSAGNAGPEAKTVGSPASLDIAFAVGATANNDDITNFSSRGPSPWGKTKPDVSAPGKSIRSTLPGGAYGELSGTSMAAPHVSGLAALLLEAAPTLNNDPAAIANAITSTAIALSAPTPNNDYGWGRVDAYNAVMSVASIGRLQGVVRGNGSLLSKASLHIVPRDGQPTITTLSDANGSYSQGLAAGLYDVTAFAFGYESQTEFGVAVNTGSTTTHNFDLVAKPTGALIGTVKEKTNPAVSLAATVTVEGTSISTTSDPSQNGGYSLTLPIGVYTVTVTAPNHRIAKEINITVNDGATVTRDFLLDSAPSILLVDSGRWYQESQISYYQQALTDALYPFDTWEISDVTNLAASIPSTNTLTSYDIVIWSSPFDSPGYIGADDEIVGYLDNGGKLLLSGQDIAYFDGGGSLFKRRYFASHLKAVFKNDKAESEAVAGVADEPFDGLSFSIVGGDGANNQITPDVIEIIDSDFAGPLLTYSDEDLAGLHVGLCVPYRAVYLPFGLEGISSRTDRRDVMGRAIGWLTEAPAPVGIELSPVEDVRVGNFGVTISHTARLRNTGTSSDIYSLAVSAGAPYNWAKSGTPTTVNLKSCEAQEISLNVTVPAANTWHISDTFTISAQSTNNTTVSKTVTRTSKTPAPVLLVDDDRWYSFAEEFKESLAANGIPYDYWLVPKSWGGPVPPSPPLKTLEMYPITVWYTAYDWFQPLTPTEEDRLVSYLEGGGRLFLSSQDFLYKHLQDHDDDYSPFAQDYLGVLTHTEDYSSTLVSGEPNSLVGPNLGPYNLTFPPGYQNYSDALSPTTSARAATRGQDDQINGLTNAGAGASGRQWHTNFFAWGPELLTADERARLMQRSVGWLSWLGSSTVTPNVSASLDGQIIEYTAIITNNGWADLSTTHFTATFPAELNPGAASSELLLSQGNFVWSGPIAKNERKIFTYTATISGSLPLGTTVSQTSWLGYPDHNILFDRVASVHVNFPDLTGSSFDVTPTQGVDAGDKLNYTLTLRNDGLVDAPIVTATNTLPHMLEFDAVGSPTQGNLIAAGRSLTWTTSLAKDEVATMTYSAVISYQSSLPIENIVRVDSGVGKPLVLKARTSFKAYPMYFPLILKQCCRTED